MLVPKIVNSVECVNNVKIDANTQVACYKINCDNSLKIYAAYQNSNKDTYYLLMEQCDGNMEKYIKDRGYPLT